MARSPLVPPAARLPPAVAAGGTVAATLLLVGIAVLFHRLAPESYMDEPFHVPQTQRYCEGRWREWDPKITTLPGLYLLGLAAGRLHGALFGALAGVPPPQLCGTTALRAANLAAALACLPLFYAAAAAADPARTRRQLVAMTAAAFLFPLHFFFSFLYYTDVPSLLFTLACHLAATRRSYKAAGLLGAAAVLMRQTNAVWVAFSLGATLLDRCLPEEAAPSGGGAKRRQRQQRGGGKGGNGSSSRGGGAGEHVLLQMADELQRLARQAWVLRRPLAADLWPLAAVLAAFAAFVKANGGIVVGDRDQHAAVWHWAQPLYCLLYCTAALAPVFWTPAALASAAQRAVAAAHGRPAAAAATLVGGAALAAAAVARGTLAHPYLLADNRHYAFYVWRRIINASPWARYALIPAYLHSAAALGGALAHRRALWVAGLAGAAALVLVPAHLIEPRYFTVPFYLAFLHMRTPSVRALAAVAALWAAADAAALYLFLARPFAWPDGSVARFMW